MSYQEKRIITSIASGLIIMGVYVFQALARYRAGGLPLDDLVSWARLMLYYIAVGIIATIILQIVFHILLSVGVAVRENLRGQSSDDQSIERSIKQEMVEDERDTLIELKSLRVGYILVGFALVSALISLILGYPNAVMLNIMFLSFFAGSILEGLLRLYYYRKGS